MIQIVYKKLLQAHTVYSYVRQMLGGDWSDSQLDPFILAAIAHFERHSGYSFNRYEICILITIAEDDYLGRYVALPLPPVQEIKKVEGSNYGEFTELSTDEYSVMDAGTTLILPKTNHILFRVTYTAGFSQPPDDAIGHVASFAYKLITEYNLPPPPDSIPRFSSPYLERHL